MVVLKYVVMVVDYFVQDTGWTAIFMAAKNDRVGILKQLLLHGAKPELAVSGGIPFHV